MNIKSGHLFRILKYISPAAPPSGENAMTSFPAKNWIISETVHDRRLVTICYKVGFGLSETANINHLQRPLAGKHNDVISG